MFTYKGIRSDAMHLQIENNLRFTAPRRNVDLISVPGRDGELLLDQGRFEPVNQQIPCRMVLPTGQNVEQAASQLHNWLSTDVGYHNFTWSGDPDFVYKAMVNEGFNTQRVMEKYGRTVLKFRFHPIKYLASSLIERPVANNSVINNPYAVEAKPRLRIVGGGREIRINVGGQEVVLTDIPETGCIIDTETQMITNAAGTAPLFRNMRSAFPVLRSGDNRITFPSNVQVHVISRLGALL